MASIAQVWVEVLPDTSKLARQIERALRDINAREAGRKIGKELQQGIGDTKVELKVDSKKAKAEIEKATKGKTAEVQVDADTAKAEAQIDAAARDRTATVHVKAEADKSAQLLLGGGGGGGGRGGGLSSWITDPKKLFASTQALGLAPNVVPLIGSMVQGVGQLSGVLGLLPATAGAAALAIGSLKIAVSGFGDAVKAGMSGDVEKFGESLAKIAPNAQEAARAVVGLKPEMDKLKFTVQDAGFQGMGEQIQKLGSTYLPIFRTTMSTMAQSANKALRGVGDMFQTPAMQGDVKRFGANAAKGFDTLSGALKPVVKAFSDIAVVGSDFLPGLALTVKDLADRFGTFIANARESGKLHDWIQTGIDAFRDLKDIAVNVWDIFKGIFGAADTNGRTFLGTVKDITDRMNAWVNSDVGQGKLKKIFSDAKDELDKWWPVLQQLPGIAFTAFAGMKSASDQWFPIIKQITQMLKDHPGLVTAAAAAYGAFKMLPGLSALNHTLGIIDTMLKLTLPASARVGAAGISSALSGIVLNPVTLTIMLAIAGGALAIWAGNKLLNERGVDIALPVDTGTTPVVAGDGVNQIPVLHGDQSVGGNNTQGGNRTSRNVPTLIGPAGSDQGPNPQNPFSSTHPGVTPPIPTGVQPSPNALPDVGPDVPTVSDYPGAPPAVSPSGGNGSDTGGHTIAPSGFPWDRVMVHEGGTWDNHDSGHNGHYGGLQFSPETWKAYGGEQFASRADYATPDEQMTVADRTAFYGWQGLAPQGLGAWEAITKGMVPGITTSTVPPRPTPQYGSAISPVNGNGSSLMPQHPGGFPQGSNVTYTKQVMQSLGIPPLYTNPAGGGEAQIPEWVQSFVREHGGPSLRAMSTPHPGLHGDAGGPGWAVDVMGDPAEMDRLAKFLVENPDASAQLIHQSTITGTQYGVAGGKNVSGSYYGSTYGEETGMVHWAPSGTPTDVSYPSVNPSPSSSAASDANSYGKSLGEQIVSGMMEVFGLGDLFKDPTQFGLFRLVKAFLGLRPGGTNGESNGGNTNADNGSGGDNGLLGWATNLVPGANGNSIAEDLGAWNAPGGSNGLTGFNADLVNGGNNVDNSITINNENAPADSKFIVDTLDTTLGNGKRSAMNNMPSG